MAESPRHINLAQAQAILAATPAHITTVGVFRDHTAEQILELIDTLDLDAAQLHGNGRGVATGEVAARVGMVILATTVQELPGRSIDGYPEAIVMLDGPAPGSGATFDWDSIGDLATRRKVLLAGGLRPDNVEDAIRQVRPWGIDVATGVETSPGRKDADTMAHFIARARATPLR